MRHRFARCVFYCVVLSCFGFCVVSVCSLVLFVEVLCIPIEREREGEIYRDRVTCFAGWVGLCFFFHGGPQRARHEEARGCVPWRRRECASNRLGTRSRRRIGRPPCEGFVSVVCHRVFAACDFQGPKKTAAQPLASVFAVLVAVGPVRGDAGVCASHPPAQVLRHYPTGTGRLAPPSRRCLRARPGGARAAWARGL